MVPWIMVNRNAGRTCYEAVVDAAHMVFGPQGCAIASDVPDAPRRPPRLVVAAGGDGTVNRILNAYDPKHLTLGIIPLGTANDLAHELSLPSTVAAALDVVREGRSERIDLLTVNGRRFVTSGGIGLATDVALLATKWKAAGGWRARVARRLGPAVYVLGTVWEALLPRNPIDLSVDLDGRARRALVSMLIVSNQPRIGGRFAPSPDASNHDGLLDVCLVNAPRSRLRLLWVCFQIFLGRPDRCREITRERGRRLRIEATQALTFFGDGEVLARSRRLSIDTLEGALRVATTRPRARHAEEVTHA